MERLNKRVMLKVNHYRGIKTSFIYLFIYLQYIFEY